MYYRYKSKKKDRRILKYFFLILILSSIIYGGYHYRNQLMFWKISHNRIVAEITSVSQISDPLLRHEKLKKLKEDLSLYKQENDMEPEAYTLSGRIDYNLGITGVNNDFSDIYLNETGINLTDESRGYLIDAIKNISKAAALLDGGEMDVNDMFILSQAYYLTGYYNNDEIYTMLREYIKDGEGLSVENARFFAVVCITGGNIEEGLNFLQAKGGVEDSVKGKLLWAKALRDSLKFTESIIAFQKILKTTEDAASQRIAYLNLGKIYYGQHLYRESMDQFTAALALGDSEECRIWIGKNYFALGQKEKAKEVWTEVFNANNANEEVKKLLGMI